MVQIAPYTADLAVAACAAYNAWLCDVPHNPPVSLVTWRAEFAAQGTRYLAEQALVALEGDTVVGLAHAAVATGSDPAEATPPSSALRFFAYTRGQRAAGAALLAQAEDWLAAHGARSARALHYDDRYSFYHLPHVYLSERLDHVRALLGANGWQPGQCELVLDWPNFEPRPSAPVGLELALTMRWEPMPDGQTGLVLLAHQGAQEVGVCVCAPVAREHGWVYTRWLGVAEELRGQGLGRYLLHTALAELRALGYRHAAIGCIGDNYRALQIYSNMGYRTVDWSFVWEKSLG